MLRSKSLIIGLALIAVVTVGALRLLPDDDYQVKMQVPAADGLFVGARAFVDGQPAGQVTAIDVAGNAAELTLSLDPEVGPLHAGTQARIRWNSLVGRRQVEIEPGPTSNPELREGMVIPSQFERVELDDIVAALDEPTRAKVKTLVDELNTTLKGNETTLNDTLRTAGPFVGALGEVLAGLGEDGPAIRALMSDLQNVTSVLALRDADMAETVQNLSSLVAAAADQQQQVSDALSEVPSTLRAGIDFFETVPAAVDKTVPVLEGLQPATAQLPAVARRLNPVLTDLRPTVAELRPTLTAARTLLDETPGLLDLGNATIPDLDSALSTLQPAVSFLRPYTPEVIGFLTNWTSLFSAKNKSGHFGRALVPASASSFNSNPGILPPGMFQAERPAPGSLVRQPWTDANGDGIR